MLEARGLSYQRDGQQILTGIDLTVAAAQSLAVTGPSGSGKSSLLAILAGLTAPTEGSVLIDGKPLTGFSRPGDGVSVVLQGYGLVALLTAAENVEVALWAAGHSPAAARSQALTALELLGLLPQAGQLIHQLSGGQQQRTAVARALALQPRLLIADEPTAELDPDARTLALTRMFEAVDGGSALVLATHDPEVAERCDQVPRPERRDQHEVAAAAAATLASLAWPECPADTRRQRRDVPARSGRGHGTATGLPPPARSGDVLVSQSAKIMPRLTASIPGLADGSEHYHDVSDAVTRPGRPRRAAGRRRPGRLAGREQVAGVPVPGRPGQAVRQALRGRGVEFAVQVPPRDVGAVDGEVVVFVVRSGGAREHVKHSPGPGGSSPADSMTPGTSSDASGRSSRSASRVACRYGARTSGWSATSGHRSGASSIERVRCLRDDDLVTVNRADPVWRGDVVLCHAVGDRECRPQRAQLWPGHPARWVGEPAQQLIRAAGLGEQSGEGRADPERASDRRIREDAGERGTGVGLAGDGDRVVQAGKQRVGVRGAQVGQAPPAERHVAAQPPGGVGRDVRVAAVGAGGPGSAR